MSYGEPFALSGQAELERAATVVAASEDVRATTAETQFLERLRAGEAAAFDYLVMERSGDIHALLYRLTEDAEEARDLTQETFLQAFRSIAHFRGDSDLRTWLYRIAINKARNRRRWWQRRRRDVTVSLDAGDAGSNATPLGARLPDTNGLDPEQLALARERERALTVALRALTRSYREVVILRDVEGLSYEEVAAALEISVGTVKSRLSRGRTELRRRLAGAL